MRIREKLFPLIKSNWIVVSFSTETLNKNPIYAERNWFVNFLTHHNYEYKKLVFENEVFYVIRNQNNK